MIVRVLKGKKGKQMVHSWNWEIISLVFWQNYNFPHLKARRIIRILTKHMNWNNFPISPRGVARGVLGFLWPPPPPPSASCKPFLSKPSTGGKNDMTIWWVPSLWHGVAPLWKLLAVPLQITYSKKTFVWCLEYPYLPKRRVFNRQLFQVKCRTWVKFSEV